MASPVMLTRRQLGLLGLAAAGAALTVPVIKSDTVSAATLSSIRETDPDVAALVSDEVDRSIRWLWDYSTSDPNAGGYGLVRDRDDNDAVASIAATGFAMAAWCIGIERRVLDRAAVIDRIRGSLRALAGTVPQRAGMMMHFVVPQTGRAALNSEYSTIDTTLALCGAIVAAGYTRDPVIAGLTDDLLDRVEWAAYLRRTTKRTYLRMGWSDTTNGFVGTWNMTAEQLCMYLLAAGHPDVPADTATALYRDFNRPVGRYLGDDFFFEPGGTLFTYQYSHAFFPFQDWQDADGFDWFENSRRATLANRAWCLENTAGFRTFDQGLWGSTANDGPSGYTVNGAEPCYGRPRNDGTIAPYALVGALPFAPDEAADALRVLRQRYPQAWGQYGFCDAVGDVAGKPWVARSRLGIDKGLTVLAGASALGSRLVWNCFGAHPWIARGAATLGFTRT